MTKVVLGGLFKSAHGKLGKGAVLRRRGRTTILAAAPEKEHRNRDKRKLTDGEKRGNVNLRVLNAYSARTRGGNPELWRRYCAAALARGVPVNCISNADFSHPPVVEAIDARLYRGQPGQVIRVRAHDDFDVQSVTLTLRSGDQTIESGLAQRQPDDCWHYTTTASATGRVTIEATARDWPAHAHSRTVQVDLSTPPVAETSTAARLVEEIVRMAQRRGQYLLPDGRTRVKYFDKYRLAHSPALLREIAGHLVPLLPDDTEILAGLELGGVPLATHLSLLTGKPLVLLRKQPRDWGTTAPAEGGDFAGRHVLVITDVVTTGRQLATAARHLRSAGAIITHALCIVDEQTGAPALLQKQGIALTSLFTAFELIA